jgi:hypothetical protein
MVCLQLLTFGVAVVVVAEMTPALAAPVVAVDIL